MGEIEFSSGDVLDLDNGWLGSGGVGYAFQGPLRIEGELSYRKNDYGTSDEAEGGAAMVNAYLELFEEGAFQPYVGAGAGGPFRAQAGVVRGR